MKFLPICFGSAILASSTLSVSVGNLRNLQAYNCLQWDAAGNCTQCIPRTVNINGVCTAVSDLCQTWDNSTGECTSCYGGYDLNQGACVASSSGGSGNPNPNPNQDPLCIQSDNNGDCTVCSYRSVLINGVCHEVSGQCQTWDQTTGDCTSCYGGYTLNNGVCSV